MPARRPGTAGAVVLRRSCRHIPRAGNDQTESPRVRAEQVTRIACEENLWRTTCEYSLQVSEGLLDAVELDVPASWKESVKTSPAHGRHVCRQFR